MFSSGEYTNAYASPSSEYTQLHSYYKGSQFGPKLPATVPSNAYPTILKQGNEFGYEALTHDSDGHTYYNVEKAYGNSCEPKYYVAKCPENKFIRPFVPDAGNTDVEGPPSPCPVRNEPIAEGYGYELPYNMAQQSYPTDQGGMAMGLRMPTHVPKHMDKPTHMDMYKQMDMYNHKQMDMPTHMPQHMDMYKQMDMPTHMPQHMDMYKQMDMYNHKQMDMPTHMPTPHGVMQELQDLKVLFFYDKTGCKHSRDAMEKYQAELGATPLDKVFMGVKDITMFNNEKLLTELGGTATPFFFSQVTNRSVTGFVPGLSTLIKGLKGGMSNESFHETPSAAPMTLHDRVKKLNMIVFVMQGCGYCDKMKEMLAQAGVQQMVVFADARDPKYRNELKNVRGFPHYMSRTTGKSSTGYPGSLEKMLANLE